MKRLILWLVASSIVCLGVCKGEQAEPTSEEGSSLLRVYKVNKRVSDFPEKEDFSTPEGAYVVFNRLLARGESLVFSLRRISVKSLARRYSPADAKKKDVKPEVAEAKLNALILEVRIFRGTHAAVIGKLPPTWGAPFDMRIVDLEDGRWLNVLNSRWDSMGEARASFAAYCGRYAEKPVRPRIDDPDAYLRPFVEFLRSKGEDPKAFVMEAISRHKVVIMGELHHRPRYWAFNASLVTDASFPKHVGVIYLELPSNDQHLVDKFLAAENRECDTMPVIEMLRDMLWMGWPDQAMLDFFVTVWMINQNLPAEQRLRIVLVDMKRPWKEIHKREDWREYDVDRDAFMAENILEDMKKHPGDKRNALFIVGVGHTALNLRFFEGSPLMTAGWHLREALGPENVYAIMQHRCISTNMGRMDGRLCLGLFDSAFAALDNRHLAFPLDAGPFGKEPFDADPDNPVSSTFGDGFDAYLYLGPLEYEIFSPLIAGFYTDEFVKELDRRNQMMSGEGLVKAWRLRRLDAESFIGWMGTSWGKPRWTGNILGPLNAWHYGSDWKKTAQKEKLKHALEHPEDITKAAQKLFEAIRTADYDRDWLLKNAWQKFPPGAGDYMVHHDSPAWVEWVCKTFKNNPIVSVELGRVFRDKDGRPCIPYKLTLKNGTVLKGNLPFYYNVYQSRWAGIFGIDWHLKYPDGLPEAPEPAAEKPEILAFDDFDGKLGLKWEIVNPNSSNHSVTKKAGALTITTKKGHFSKSNTNYENVFLIDTPAAEDQDFQITTCVSSFKPQACFNQAGILCWDDEDNYVKLVYEWSDGPFFTVGLETGGRARYSHRAADPAIEKVWLRIIKRGALCQCLTSVDGKSFAVQGEVPRVDRAPKQVGLFANNGSYWPDPIPVPDLDASFEFFEVATVLSEPPKAAPADRKGEVQGR